MLTFCGLQESAVCPIISSPIERESRFSPSKEKPVHVLPRARLPAGLFGFCVLLSHFQIPPCEPNLHFCKADTLSIGVDCPKAFVNLLPVRSRYCHKFICAVCADNH